MPVAETENGIVHALITRHSEQTGSDKVWAGGILEQPDGRIFAACCYGARGMSLTTKIEDMPGLRAAERWLERKNKDKSGAKGYVDVDYTDAHYGLLAALQRLFPPLEGRTASVGTHALVQAPVSDLGHVVSHVTPATLATLEAAITNPLLGITEKVNGRRTPLRYDGEDFVAYNRAGKALAGLPAGVAEMRDQLHKTGFATPFLVDGEWLPDGYVMFDLLEVDNTSVREQPYEQRITSLVQRMSKLGVVHAGWPHVQAGAPAPRIPGISLLFPAVDADEKRATIEAVTTGEGEGFVIRALNGTSVGGNTKSELKVKLVADLDAIVLRVKKTSLDHSLVLGLLRPSDGKLIEIGSLRSGFTNKTIQVITDGFASLMALPVLKVTFLPARTVGIALVEPRSGPAEIRDDKGWMDCTTDQLIELLGEDRRAMIEAAPAYTQ